MPCSHGAKYFIFTSRSTGPASPRKTARPGARNRPPCSPGWPVSDGDAAPLRNGLGRNHLRRLPARAAVAKFSLQNGCRAGSRTETARLPGAATGAWPPPPHHGACRRPDSAARRWRQPPQAGQAGGRREKSYRMAWTRRQTDAFTPRKDYFPPQDIGFSLLLRGRKEKTNYLTKYIN